mgnify:CR=1 FL=1
MGWSDFWNNLLSGGATVVQESTLPGLDYADPDIDLPGNQNAQNWRRLTQSKSDLSPLTQERMQEMALYLSDRNPLAKGIIDVMTAFVVGEGFTVTSKDDNTRKAIDRFWDDGQNDMAQRVEEFTRELAIFGEQLVLAFVNDVSGRVALVSVDPRTIRSVLPHPMATDRPYAVGLADEERPGERRWVKIITEDDDPNSDTFGKLVGAAESESLMIGQNQSRPFYQPPVAETGSRLAGCFFFPINKPRSAMRGRSDLLPVADFVDLYDRLMFDESERMSFIRTFVWDVKVTGASPEELVAKALNDPPPKPGSVKYHNESEEWNAVSPDLNSADSAITADMLLALVATGVGLPKLWLNGSMDINRATAQESADPALKRLTMRQKMVRRAIERMVRFALDTAVTAGALADEGDAGIEFTVSAAEMSSRDLERASRSLQTTVQALGMADAANWVDDRTAQEAVVLMLGQLGLDVDLDELRQRIEDQKEEDAENDQYELPPYLGMGKNPGSDALGQAMKDGGAGKEAPQTAAQAAQASGPAA